MASFISSLAMQWICFNGSFLPKEQPVFNTENRSFRYGDGIFETIKMRNGALSLSDFHFDRLYSGVTGLQFEIADDFTREHLHSMITVLCKKNNCLEAARVRLTLFRGEGNHAAYVIDAYATETADWAWSNVGWRLCLHPFVQKSCDAFANMKSANYLPYVMAARHAAQEKADECLILNVQNNICDGSRTNLFLIKEKAIYTPALHQGCVSGVMRRYLIEILKSQGFEVHEQAISVTDLMEAEEAFCTNAMIGLQHVADYSGKEFKSEQTREIFELFIKNDPLFRPEKEKIRGRPLD